MTSPCAPLSETFRQSALAERRALVERYEQCRQRHEALLQQAAEAAAEAGRYLATIRELGELLGVEDQLSIVTLADELRGERLRKVAADIVFKHFEPGEPFHYREWLELVVTSGHRVGGKNAHATFLTQVAKVDRVERVGKRTGLYQIVA